MDIKWVGNLINFVTLAYFKCKVQINPWLQPTQQAMALIQAEAVMAMVGVMVNAVVVGKQGVAWLEVAQP